MSSEPSKKEAHGDRQVVGPRGRVVQERVPGRRAAVHPALVPRGQRARRAHGALQPLRRPQDRLGPRRRHHRVHPLVRASTRRSRASLPRVFGSNLTILENNAMQSTASTAGYRRATVIHVGHLGDAHGAAATTCRWLTLMGWTLLHGRARHRHGHPDEAADDQHRAAPLPLGHRRRRDAASRSTARATRRSEKARSLFTAMGLGAVVAWLRDAHAAAGHPDPRSPHEAQQDPGAHSPSRASSSAASPSPSSPSRFEGSLIMIAGGRPDRPAHDGQHAHRRAPQLRRPRAHGARRTAPSRRTSIADGARGTGLPHHRLVQPVARRRAHGHLAACSRSPSSGAPCSRAFSGFGKLFGGKKAETAHASKTDEDARGRARRARQDRGAHVLVRRRHGLLDGGPRRHRLLRVRASVPGSASWPSCSPSCSSIVACRATGETDITPVGAMGKITQLTYGILAPANVITNLMTASITAGAAGTSADLAHRSQERLPPRRQPAQAVPRAALRHARRHAGRRSRRSTCWCPRPRCSGTDRFPAPAAQVWKGVAEVLANGVESLHPWARWGMVIGGAHRHRPAAARAGVPEAQEVDPERDGHRPLARHPVLQLDVHVHRRADRVRCGRSCNEESAETYTVPVASGIIAGESLLGVAVALLSAGGYLE